MTGTWHILVPRGDPALLSLVIPVFDEADVLPALFEQVAALIAQLPCPAEAIFVNDGSRDRSLELLRDAAMKEPRFKVVSLARNFGHQIAATAGLDTARGDAVVLMDADLQDPPELVLEMIREYRRGYDVVYAQRTRRDGESVFKRWSAWLFYRIMRLLVYKDLQPDVGDFRLISRRCLDALRRMRETHRFLRGMVTWVGFPQIGVPFVRPARAAGKTKYSLGAMIRFAWTAALSFSPLPLRLSLIGGALILCIGLAYGVYGFIEYVMGWPLVRGWFSLIVLNCLGWGSTMMAIGVLGEYVARIYEEIKGRPLYFIADTWNLDK